MNNFRYFRTKKGLSQRQVAEYLGITSQAYSNYENSKREADYATLLKLSQLFECTIEELISPSEPSSKSKNDEVEEVLEYYRTKPGMKLLFSITKDATAEDIIEAAQIIENLKQKRREE